jgi:TetR/AcrR family transcriptional repressor of nem operon
MRVSKEQVAQHRQALIEATGRLLREKGLEGAGVAEICHEAGLTHGAFYRHFASKEALMLEACAQAFDWTPLDLLGKRARGSGTTAMMTNYLSVDHRDCSVLGCPVAALAVDAARAGGEIAQAFAEGIEAYLSRFTQAVRVEDPTGSDAEAQALHMLSTMVGGLIIARATAQARPQLSRKVLRTLRKRMAEAGAAATPTSH